MSASLNEIAKSVFALPSVDELKQKLTLISNASANGATTSEVKALYDRYINVKMYGAIEEPPSTINNIKVYRGRVGLKRNEDTSLIRTFSYPSQSVTKYTGRANIKGKPVFYSSIGMNTAFIETKPAVGDSIYFGEWSFNVSRNILLCLQMHENHISANNPWRKIIQGGMEKLDSEFKKYFPDHVEHLHIINEFWCFMFANEPKPYPLTSDYSNNLLYNIGGFDAIVYPSFMAKHSNCNLVFHPNFVDRYMQLSRLFKYKVKAVSDSSISFNALSAARFKYNQITWERPNEEDLAYWDELNKGQIVEPETEETL